MIPCLGIDTGGTYTDAVIIDFSTGRILSKAKSQTTYDDLSLGIDSAIGGLDGKYLREVQMVSMSSTLATNSIVEGKGGRVGLVGVGLDFDRSVSVDMMCTVKGRYNLHGRQTETMDEEKVKEFLESAKGKIDALAVSGYLSVRNPYHEMRVKTLSDQILGVPVVCGHQLSVSLGFDERAVTAIMNARLLPVIRKLMDSVRKSLLRAGVDAPFMVVKGDGSLMSEATALEKPIETIVSGPAASLIGAKALTGRDDAIVMDMGGTTTDIGVLRNGQPRLVEEGAVIGGKRTKVLAASITTTGLGGDSRIVSNGGRLYVGPYRAIPLCDAASRWPVVKECLKALFDGEIRIPRKVHDYSSVVLDCEFFVRDCPGDDCSRFDIKEKQRMLVELADKGPVSLAMAERETGIHPLMFDDSCLEKMGIVRRIGFTPTDVLHALGEYVVHDAEASVLGARYMAKLIGMDLEDFLRHAKSLVVDRLAETLVRDLVMEETGLERPSLADTDFMRKSITGDFGKDCGCFIRFNKPIIGIGAPVAAYLPEVAEKFDAELLLPENTDVGNAVGAVAGSIVETVRIIVRPADSEADHENAKATMMSPLERREFSRFTDAVRHAEKISSAEAMRMATAQGAADPSVTVHREDHWFGENEGSGILIETTVVATAIGKPRFMGDSGNS